MDLRESAFNALPLSDSEVCLLSQPQPLTLQIGDNDAELNCKMLDSGAGRRPNALS